MHVSNSCWGRAATCHALGWGWDTESNMTWSCLPQGTPGCGGDGQQRKLQSKPPWEPSDRSDCFASPHLGLPTTADSVWLLRGPSPNRSLHSWADDLQTLGCIITIKLEVNRIWMAAITVCQPSCWGLPMLQAVCNSTVRETPPLGAEIFYFLGKWFICPGNICHQCKLVDSSGFRRKFRFRFESASQNRVWRKGFHWCTATI